MNSRKRKILRRKILGLTRRQGSCVAELPIFNEDGSLKTYESVLIKEMRRYLTPQQKLDQILSDNPNASMDVVETILKLM